MEKHRLKEIPKKKKERVEELAEFIKNHDSMLIVSIKNLPTKQLQLISKKLRDKAEVKVVKKSLLNRAIDKIEKGNVKNLKKYVDANTALLFSEIDPFELSAMLSKNKSKAKAKAGDVVKEEIVIEEGPTELTPGPVISQLGNMGIPFEIKEGKINIKERKVLLQAGEEVDGPKADMMSKLDMTPIDVGLTPIAAYCGKEDKLYENIEVDSEKTVEELKEKYPRALAFAVTIAFPCKETIGFILAKAASHEKALDALSGEDKTEEKEGTKDEKEEESKEEKGNEEKKEDDSKKEENQAEQDNKNKSKEEK